MTASRWLSGGIVLLLLAVLGLLAAAVATRFWEHPPLSRGRLRFMVPVIGCCVLAAALAGVQALVLDD